MPGEQSCCPTPSNDAVCRTVCGNTRQPSRKYGQQQHHMRLLSAPQWLCMGLQARASAHKESQTLKPEKCVCDCVCVCVCVWGGAFLEMQQRSQCDQAPPLPSVAAAPSPPVARRYEGARCSRGRWSPRPAPRCQSSQSRRSRSSAAGRGRHPAAPRSPARPPTRAPAAHRQGGCTWSYPDATQGGALGGRSGYSCSRIAAAVGARAIPVTLRSRQTTRGSECECVRVCECARALCAARFEGKRRQPAKTKQGHA